MQRIADFGLWIADWRVGVRIRNPQSTIRNLAVEHRRLFRAPWGRKAEMLVRARRGAAAARRAGQEPLLHEERLVPFLQRSGILDHGGGDRGESHGAAVAMLDDGYEDRAVQPSEHEIH